MSIFNSLGSNYDFGYAWRALTTPNKARYSDELRAELQKRYGGPAHLVYKGREALQAALVLAGLPTGSRVGITGYTCYAVYRAVLDAGCVPELLDLGEDSLNASPKTIQTAIVKKKLAAVVVQNTLGYPCDVTTIKKICTDAKVVLIEDLAHAPGIRYAGGEVAGTVGDFVALSFSQDKMIDGVTGGALVIRAKRYQQSTLPQELQIIPGSQQLRDRFYPLFTTLIRRLYGLGLGKVLHAVLKNLHWLSKPVEGQFGAYRQLPAWNAKLILQELQRLDEYTAHRQAIAAVYHGLLPAEVQWPTTDGGEPGYLRFPIRVQKPAKLVAHLKTRDFHVSDTWYDAPVGPKQYASKVTYAKGSCSVSEAVAASMVNLPTHPSLSVRQAERLAREVVAWLS